MKSRLLLLTIAILALIPLSNISAQSVDLIWQGETYTPPFYQGKALWSNQSMITILAIPQGLGSVSSLNYKWTKNGTVLGNVSGTGRNTLRFEDSLFSKPQTVTVEIIGSGERILAESTLVLNPTTPELLVYEKNPLYGYMFHKEVGDRFSLPDEEITFSAFPLFTSPALRDGGNLTYRWRTNTGDAGLGHSVTYRIPDGSEGLATVNLTMANTGKILRNLTKSFSIRFGIEDE